jgi:hypothetical protein
MINLHMSFKVQLKSMRGFFHALRFGISCKFEGKTALE